MTDVRRFTTSGPTHAHDLGRVPCVLCNGAYRDHDPDDLTCPGPGNMAAVLLTEIIEHADENGALANATADELRDALRLAADRLRCATGHRPGGPIYAGARRLVAEVWWLVDERRIDARSRAADAALDLRDSIDTRWRPVWQEEHPRVG